MDPGSDMALAGIGDFFLRCTTSQRFALNSFNCLMMSSDFDYYGLRVRYYWFYELPHVEILA